MAAIALKGSNKVKSMHNMHDPLTRAPEVRSKDPAEKAKGLESQAFVAQWFEQPGPVPVRTSKEEKYGRMLADCYRERAPSLCTELLERSLAVPYLP